MKRKDNWSQLLNDWYEKAITRKFEWGSFDCALMAADCIRTITDTDVVPDLWGSYYTPLGAYRIQEENGGLEGICDSRIGNRIHPNLAQRGDILLLKVDNRETLSVCFGTEVLVMMKKPRLVNKRVLHILAAWRVG